MSGLYDAATLVIERVHTQLSATPSGWPGNARVYPVPGQLAWDECQCGLLAVEMQPAFFTQSFPNPSPQREDGCRPFLALPLLITVLRCAPVIEKGETSPKPSSLDLGASVMYDDVEALLRGTASAAHELYEDYAVLAYSLNNVTPVGPQGGCVGITQQIILGFNNRWSIC